MAAQRHLWLKLDSKVIHNFDARLEPRVRRIATGTGRVLRGLVAQTGILRTLGIVLRAAARPEWALVSGNIDRKRHRLPALFGIRAIAGPYGYVKAVQAALLKRLLDGALTPDTAALIYNGSVFPESVLAEVARRHALPRLYVEAGFFPGTLQIDPVGLNAANSVPRDPAFYLGATDFTAIDLPALTAVRPTKLRGAGPVDLPPGYVFVAFQVPSDMQVTLHSPWIRNMAQFLTVIRAAADRHPDDHFVIKEHPSFPLSVRSLFPPHPRVTFANDNATRDLIRDARAVVTLNSTVGVEALLLDRPVILLGDACYDIQGLVLRARDDMGLSAALNARDWRPDKALRQRVLGFLWGHYLTKGSYADPPADLADRLEALLTPPWRTPDERRI